MKLNVKAFAIAIMIVITVPSMVLFIWCAINGFGINVVQIFETLHPNGGFSVIKDASAIGVIINTIYAAVDSFIFGFAFSSLYNVISAYSERSKVN